MKAPVYLSILIAVLSLVAVGFGLFWTTDGQAYQFQTLRGETVSIFGQGLYRYDSALFAVQAQAQDLVTLGLGIPLLVVATLLYLSGSLRGRLLLCGTLAYFLYTYTSYALGVAYNPLFLVYVVLMSLSLFGFVTTAMTVEVASLPGHFSPRLPRRAVAGLLFAIGGFLLLGWLRRIVPPLLQDTPPFGLESYTTLSIQVLDLGLIVPLAILAGVLLLRREPWGYLLASIALLKGFTMATAVAAMGIGQLLAGQAVSTVEVAIFVVLDISIIGMTVVLLKNVREQADVAAPRGALVGDIVR